MVPSLVGVGGVGGFSPVDLSRMLAGKIASATPSISTYTQEISGSATPRDLETALQLNYLAFTAPNFTPETLDLLKRRLGAVLENQAQNPKAVFGEKVSLVNSSNHYSARMITAADLPSLKLDAMQQVLPGSFRQRRRLHVLLRRCVQGAGADPARRALDRRIALDRQEDRGLP